MIAVETVAWCLLAIGAVEKSVHGFEAVKSRQLPARLLAGTRHRSVDDKQRIPRRM